MCRGACEETPSWLEKIVLLASPDDALDDGSDEAFDAFVKRFKDYLSESDPPQRFLRCCVNSTRLKNLRTHCPPQIKK